MFVFCNQRTVYVLSHGGSSADRPLQRYLLLDVVLKEAEPQAEQTLILLVSSQSSAWVWGSDCAVFPLTSHVLGSTSTPSLQDPRRTWTAGCGESRPGPPDRGGPGFIVPSQTPLNTEGSVRKSVQRKIFANM